MLSIGCAARPLIRPVIQDTFTINAAYDDTWWAVVSTLSGMSIQVETIDKDSGLLNTKFIYFSGGMYADKDIEKVAAIQTSFLLIWTRGRFKLNIYASKLTDSQTQLKITLRIEGYESNISKGWNVLYSKGVIERRIAEIVDAKVNAVSMDN